MAEISNLITNNRKNAERPNLRVTKIGNENWEVEEPNLIYIKEQI